MEWGVIPVVLGAGCPVLVTSFSSLTAKGFHLRANGLLLQSNRMFGEIRNKQGERLDYSFHSGRGEANALWSSDIGDDRK